MEGLTTPEIFAFSLGDASQQSLLQDTHNHLMNAIAAKSRLRKAATKQEALELFNQNDSPQGVFVTDAGIVTPTNDDLSQKLVDYVRNGGTLVLGGLFSALIRPSEMGKYMKGKWDLPWEAGSFSRTTMILNHAVIDRPTSGLLSSYSHKALFLKNVKPDMAWYVATDRSVIGSLAPLGGPGIDSLETSVAFARLENGRIGYVGDVNGEEGTTAVVLIMLGLTS